MRGSVEISVMGGGEGEETEAAVIPSLHSSHADETTLYEQL